MTADPIPQGERAAASAGGDAELSAAKVLHSKIQRTRKRAAFACLMVGLFVGAILAATGQSLLASMLGGRIAIMAVMLLFFAPILGALKAAELIADAAVKRAIGGWIVTLSKEFGVEPGSLEDHARIAGA